MKTPELIPDWRRAPRFFSVQGGTLGALALLIFVEFPDAALAVWGLMPHELRSVIPPEKMVYVSLIFLAFSIIGRLIKQEKPRD